ncbi:roadblock/LC7 domain-containing protein [Nocardia sp. CDC159]|uniref:Roadblock/LC7 domain-containing protein n=1 Tax=Nocardia pulmonis TaxID=2951408 RepID=A0A9X2J0F0_9NOCA|nr:MULTISPECIES: roadblock/LC7 domain-containing protein [Nocardia]MCM6775886.1 roadblock/LC7 domain-containing protein [Nocardia pulmonis]MCM6788138.1 roadblock/LC7 domain-containing protein [Nocardia sp. CDC159]
MTTSQRTDLGWLLDDLINGLAGAESAVLLSTDGLLLGRSGGLEQAEAERFSAMASALHSLARSAGQHFQAGGVCQTVIELDHAVLFITAAGANACLALLATENADMGMVAYEMNQTVQRLGSHLSVDPRGSIRQ